MNAMKAKYMIMGRNQGEDEGKLLISIEREEKSGFKRSINSYIRENGHEERKETKRMEEV